MMDVVKVVEGSLIFERVSDFASRGVLTEIDSQLAETPWQIAKELAQEINAPELLECRELLTAHTVAGIHVKGSFESRDLSIDTPRGFLPIPVDAATVRAKLALLAMMGSIGAQPVAYGSENEGALFVNLSPIEGEGRAAEKSTARMRGHTDAVSFPFPNAQLDRENMRIAPSPDFVCLACLRNPAATQTRLMPLDAILKHLDDRFVDELLKSQFTIGCQYTFRAGTKKILGRRHIVFDANILRRTEAGYLVRYSHSNTDADEDNVLGREAIEAFESAVALCDEGVALSPGDVLIVNNRKAMHGRSEVGAGDSAEQPRWLLRGYGLHAQNLPETSLYDGSEFKLFP